MTSPHEPENDHVLTDSYLLPFAAVHFSFTRLKHTLLYCNMDTHQQESSELISVLIIIIVIVIVVTPTILFGDTQSKKRIFCLRGFLCIEKMKQTIGRNIVIRNETKQSNTCSFDKIDIAIRC